MRIAFLSSKRERCSKAEHTTSWSKKRASFASWPNGSLPEIMNGDPGFRAIVPGSHAERRSFFNRTEFHIFLGLGDRLNEKSIVFDGHHGRRRRGMARKKRGHEVCAFGIRLDS